MQPGTRPDVPGIYIERVTATIAPDELVVDFTVTNWFDQPMAVGYAIPRGGRVGAPPDPELVLMVSPWVNDAPSSGIEVGFWAWAERVYDGTDSRQPEEFPSLFMIRLEPDEQVTRRLRLPRPLVGMRYPGENDEVPDPPEWIKVCLGVAEIWGPGNVEVIEPEPPFDRPLYEASQSGNANVAGITVTPDRTECSNETPVHPV